MGTMERNAHYLALVKTMQELEDKLRKCEEDVPRENERDVNIAIRNVEEYFRKSVQLLVERKEALLADIEARAKYQSMQMKTHSTPYKSTFHIFICIVLMDSFRTTSCKNEG